MLIGLSPIVNVAIIHHYAELIHFASMILHNSNKSLSVKHFFAAVPDFGENIKNKEYKQETIAFQDKQIFAVWV